jgi:hypothetical protein
LNNFITTGGKNLKLYFTYEERERFHMDNVSEMTCSFVDITSTRLELFLEAATTKTGLLLEVEFLVQNYVVLTFVLMHAIYGFMNGLLHDKDNSLMLLDPLNRHITSVLNIYSHVIIMPAIANAAQYYLQCFLLQSMNSGGDGEQEDIINYCMYFIACIELATYTGIDNQFIHFIAYTFYTGHDLFSLLMSNAVLTKSKKVMISCLATMVCKVLSSLIQKWNEIANLDMEDSLIIASIPLVYMGSVLLTFNSDLITLKSIKHYVTVRSIKLRGREFRGISTRGRE